MINWHERAKLQDLRAVIDPADTTGHKNRYINFLHHKILSDAIGNSLNGKRVLDLGCGIGRFTTFLKECGAEVTGVDSCIEMLDKNPGNWVKAPVDQLPFENESFDAVLSVWMLQHLSDNEFERATAEIRRVLVMGGNLYMIEQLSMFGYDGVYPRTIYDYIGMCLKCHFKFLSSRPIAHGNDPLFGIVKRGLVFEVCFPTLANIHLSLTRGEKMKYSTYLDYFMVLEKVYPP